MSETAVSGLTHVDSACDARMVDVSGKAVTARSACASGRVLLSAEAVAALRAGEVPKGDALAVARIAGIAGAKRTPDLIPLCHPIGLHGVTVDLTVTDEGVDITAVARTADRTGVEMEALTSVSVAALALIDMVKAIDPAAMITDVRVEWKEGGKTGPWRRPEDAAMIRALAVTVSNRAAAGVYADTSGPVLVEALRSAGCAVDGPLVIPDGEPVEAALRDALAAGYDVVVTTGGTGLTPGDLTPEMTRRVVERDIPGIAEAVRSAGAAAGVPSAILSRGVAGVAGRTLIVNLPGSSGGVRDGMAVLAPVLGHAVSQINGGDHVRTDSSADRLAEIA